MHRVHIGEGITEFIQMVSQAFVSDGQAEFRNRSTTWAITQVLDSIPPRLVRNTIVEVFLSTGFDRSEGSDTATGTELCELQQSHLQTQHLVPEGSRKKNFGENSFTFIRAIRQEEFIGKIRSHSGSE
ncbi:hypothetical protein TNIN_141551 [Trichonephila inaurata madagascariensis]|uniref:Uncharacterized protein n=1 Tax=Trichonephila inaurata madagascariensis TaxID=2747483 RepID=A0A8X6YD28_9ARAC|nr:hypothetical protein TNIN_141551 [Trichonephila inaurata madagascariensis]